MFIQCYKVGVSSGSVRRITNIEEKGHPDLLMSSYKFLEKSNTRMFYGKTPSTVSMINAFMEILDVTKLCSIRFYILLTHHLHRLIRIRKNIHKFTKCHQLFHMQFAYKMRCVIGRCVQIPTLDQSE